MASEVQMINQAVDTAFAEEEVKDIEEDRDNVFLNTLDNLNASLLGGIATKEGIDVVKDLTDRRTDVEKLTDKINEYEELSKKIKNVPNIKEDEVPSETLSEIQSGDLEDPPVSAAKVADKVVVNNAPEVSASDYVDGILLKSFDMQGDVLNRPINHGMKLAMNYMFGFNRKDKK
jgi:hypothetical protein